MRTIVHRWFRTSAASLALLVALGADALCQTKTNPAATDIFDNGTLGTADIRGLVRSAELAPVASDGPVDPTMYYVGPGDVLSIHIFWNSPLENQLTITAEGNLLVPNVGAIDLRGLTLAETKATVAAVIHKKYVHADATTTLVQPRRITVDIMGEVINEGKKEISAIQRVDNVIALSNRFPEQRLEVDDYARTLYRLRYEASERRITVRSRDGSTRRIDLAKFRATGADRYNPYLRDGDVIYVPRREQSDLLIGIFGATQKSADFEFVPGDSLSDLIVMGLGFKDETDPDHSILTRLSTDGHMMDTMVVNARSVLNGTAPNLALRPGDRLVIPHPREMRRDYRVKIEGEIMMPGTYPISRNGTRLSEILRTAGGLTPLANLRGATLTRQRNTANEDLDLERLRSRRVDFSGQDTNYYFAEAAIRFRVGEIVSVDFYKLVVGRDSTQDVLLRPDDMITIPTRMQTIYVFGQVVSPGHVPFVEGQKYDRYIALTGGFASEARKSEIRVIKGSSRAWLDPDDTVLEDGDMIWVPKEVYHPFSYYMTIYAQVASIIGTAATIALLIKTFQ